MGPLLLLFFFQAGAHQAAMQAFNEHRYAEAAQQFIAALKTEAEGSAEYQESVLSLGESLYFQKKFAEAIPWFEKAATAGSQSLVAAFMLGNASIQGRADEKALARLRLGLSGEARVGGGAPAAGGHDAARADGIGSGA